MRIARSPGALGAAATAAALAWSTTDGSAQVVPDGPVRAVESAQPKPPGNDVVLGFRADIPPFSFKAPDFGGNDQEESRPYLGYVADLCYRIFDNSIYEVVEVPVTADDRFERMKRRPPPDDSGWPSPPEETARPVDVLCDATTLRLDDPNRIEVGVFSPIVFVSGVSYLARSVRRYRDVEVGYVGNSTSERVAKEACSVDAMRLSTGANLVECRNGDPNSQCMTPGGIVASVSDAAVLKTIEQLEDEKKAPVPSDTRSMEYFATQARSYVLCPMGSHDRLVEWFCSDGEEQVRARLEAFPDNTDLSDGQRKAALSFIRGQLRSRETDKLYIGDRDIILGKIAEWDSQHSGKCEGVRDSGVSVTYEPYALLIAKDRPDLISFVQRRVYEIFSHRDGAEALFYKWFPEGQKMSQPLAWQFVLNGVMSQSEILSGKKLFEGIAEPGGN